MPSGTPTVVFQLQVQAATGATEAQMVPVHGPLTDLSVPTETPESASLVVPVNATVPLNGLTGVAAMVPVGATWSSFTTLALVKTWELPTRSVTTVWYM